MCRLFASISPGQLDTRGALFAAPQSLLHQSRADRRHPQADGWGVGWFARKRPVILKSPKPVFREVNRLRRAAGRVGGGVLFGHVRWASNPLKLPKNRLIGYAHTQPFAHGKWLFAHNGTLLIPKEVRQALGRWDQWIQGQNDSEVLFYWLLKHLGSARSPADIAKGVQRALAALNQVWEKCRKSYPLYKYPAHGLNWVLSNGHILAAHCYVNPGGFGKAKALCCRTEPYYQLRYKDDKTAFTVASEPLDPSDGWKAMKHGELMVAIPRRRKVKWFRYSVRMPTPSSRKPS